LSDLELADELDIARDRVLIDNTSQAVFKHLNQFESEKSLHMSRWIWELLQNARDATPKDGNLKIELSFSPSQLAFRHNGIPFTDKEIAHLIYHGSTKHDDPKLIGHFGSGFVSTHLISRKITVRGQIMDNRYFEFVLDRDGNSPEQLSEAMNRSWKEFKDSLNILPISNDDGFTTEYAYPLNVEASQVVTDGVETFEHYCAYIFAFNPMLNSIRVCQSDQVNHIQKTSEESLDKDIILFKIQHSNNEGSYYSHLVVAKDEKVSIAVLLGENGGQFCVEPDSSTPKIFIAFPLFGTEDFCFPAVINSEHFSPREQRDGIYLGIGDNEANRCNQELVGRASELSLKLMLFAAQNRWGNVHSLVQLSELKSHEWLKEDWYKKLIRDSFVEEIRHKAILENAGNDLIQPADAWIPVHTGEVAPEMLWDLVSNLKSVKEKLPKREYASGWSEILESWIPFLNNSIADLPESVTVTKLAEQIAQMSNVPSLQSSLDEGIDPMMWLDNFYELIFQTQLITLFDKLPLLPNQNGAFITRQKILRDEGIDGALKDIAKHLGQDIRASLLRKEIRFSSVLSLLTQKTENDLLIETVERLKNKQAEFAVNEDLRNANLLLFKWILEHGQLDRLDGFPVLTEAEINDRHYVQKLVPGINNPEEMPLAPLQCWPELAREFSDLFPKRFILSAAYYDKCSDLSLWSQISQQGYVLTSPLYLTHERIKGFLPDDPLPEGASHEASKAVEVSTISFLKKEDIGLIDTARKSKTKAISLLQFLLKFVLAEDNRAFEKIETDCECGQQHKYYRAAWLIPLNQRKWIPIGENKTSLPSAESLASLLVGKEDMVKLLREGRPAELLQVLGVSIGDFLLRFVTDDEDSRITLISSVTDIFKAAGNDTDRIRSLAEEIKNNPDIIQELEERKQKREQVKQNQAVGKLVEDLLKQALTSENLQMKRKPIGSDFEIEYDFVEGDEEIALEVKDGSKSYLIEVKATTESNVRMSVRQVETAAKQKDHFVLCMVKLDSSAAVEADIREGARFIFNIGSLVEPLWGAFSDLQNAKDSTCIRIGDIAMEIQESQTRFRVGNDTWTTGMLFDEAVSFLKTNLAQTEVLGS